MVLVFLSIMNYLIDAYTIYAASVLAANSVLRSLFGAVFPLFTTYMYTGLGIHWASSIPAFLALACVPFPFLFYKYGPAIRRSCKYAREADEAMDQLKRQSQAPPDSDLGADHVDAELKGAESATGSASRSSFEGDEEAGEKQSERDTAAGGISPEGVPHASNTGVDIQTAPA